MPDFDDDTVMGDAVLHDPGATHYYGDDNPNVQQAADLMWDSEYGPNSWGNCRPLAESLHAAGLLANPAERELADDAAEIIADLDDEDAAAWLARYREARQR